MNTHTPGKWEATETTVYAGREIVADCEPHHTTKSGDTCEANARLCAAAPDLLEACEDAIKSKDMWSCEMTDEDLRLYRKISAAIHKASGGMTTAKLFSRRDLRLLKKHGYRLAQGHPLRLIGDGPMPNGAWGVAVLLVMIAIDRLEKEEKVKRAKKSR
jgi:hypothetical protein